MQICNKLRPLKENTETSKSFGILQTHEELGNKVLYYVGEYEKSNACTETKLYVYDTDFYGHVDNVANYIPLANSEPTHPTPIATATLRTTPVNATICDIYVGKKYRRNRIGSSLCNICEDITYNMGYSNLYAVKSIQDYRTIDEIRKAYGQVGPCRELYEYITRYNSPNTRNKITKNFLLENGFNASMHPLHISNKTNIINHDILNHDTYKSDIMQFKTIDFIKELKEQSKLRNDQTHSL